MGTDDMTSYLLKISYLRVDNQCSDKILPILKKYNYLIICRFTLEIRKKCNIRVIPLITETSVLQHVWPCLGFCWTGVNILTILNVVDRHLYSKIKTCIHCLSDEHMVILSTLSKNMYTLRKFRLP